MLTHRIRAGKKASKKHIKTHPKRSGKKSPVKRNWRAYEAEQKRRYDLEVWFSEEVLENWYNSHKSYGRRGRGYRYSAAAILSTLGAGALFKHPLRGAEHFTNSLLRLMGRKDLQAPDHSTLCRARQRLHIPLVRRMIHDPQVILFDGTGMKVYGAGEWLRDKHKVEKNSRWRKLTVCMDYTSGQILSHTLQPSSGSGTGETSQVGPLLEALPEAWTQSTHTAIADALYDTKACYELLDKRSIWPVIPPAKDAVYGLHPERDRHVKTLGWHGYDEWRDRTDYGRRSLVETSMSRIKGLTGDRLMARSLEAQRAEMSIRLMALNMITNPAVQLRSG